MPVKKNKSKFSDALSQGNAGIEGSILGPFTPSLPLIEGERPTISRFVRGA